MHTMTCTVYSSYDQILNGYQTAVQFVYVNKLYALKDRHGIYICKHTMHNIMFEVHGTKGNADRQQYTSYRAITLDCIINEGGI